MLRNLCVLCSKKWIPASVEKQGAFPRNTRFLKRIALYLKKFFICSFFLITILRQIIVMEGTLNANRRY